MYEITWSEHQKGKKPRYYKVRIKKIEEVKNILETLIQPMPGILIKYKVFNPEGRLIDYGTI